MSTAALPLLGFTPGHGHDVVLDFDGVLEFGLFVEGVSRSGKSNLVRAFLEQTHGLALQLVLDPEGEYATLRTAERPYLVVGRGRDVAIAATDTAVRGLVEQLLARQVSAVFDLSDYDDEEQQTIVIAVCDALVRLPEGQPHDVVVAIEELQDFAPESGSGGKAAALAAVQRLVKRGRKRGVTVVGASQRVADVKKGVVTQLKNKAIGGTDHSDAARALVELGLPAKERAAVTELAQGTFWVKGPAVSRHAQLVRVPRAETAPAKRRRGMPAPPAPEAPAEIAAFASTFADAAAGTASAEAEAPVDRNALADEYQRGRADALAELSAVIDDTVALAQQRLADQATATQAAHEAVRQVLVGLADFHGHQLRALADRRDVTYLAPVRDEEADAQNDRPAARNDRAPARNEAPSAQKGRPAARNNASGAQATGDVEQRILDTLAAFSALGVEDPPRNTVAAMVGYHPTTKAFTYAVSALSKGGEIVAGGGSLALTTLGVQRAVPPAAPPTKKALHEAWCQRLDDAAARMLRVLIAAHPDGVERNELAGQLGYAPTTKAFTYAVSALRALGLATTGSGSVRGTDLLFPKGLR